MTQVSGSKCELGFPVPQFILYQMPYLIVAAIY